MVTTRFKNLNKLSSSVFKLYMFLMPVIYIVAFSKPVTNPAIRLVRIGFPISAHGHGITRMLCACVEIFNKSKKKWINFFPSKDGT